MRGMNNKNWSKSNVLYQYAQFLSVMLSNNGMNAQRKGELTDLRLEKA